MKRRIFCLFTDETWPFVVVKKKIITKQKYKMAKPLQLECYESDLGKMA